MKPGVEVLYETPVAGRARDFFLADLRQYANSKAVLVTDVNETRVVNDRTLLISAAQLLFP